VDLTPASYVEAWDLNAGREWLAGLQTGLDRRVWRGMAVRAEALVLHVRQDTDDGWLRGGTIGMRVRSRSSGTRIYFDLAGGRSHATGEVPPGGTRVNYLLMLGGGIEFPWSRAHVNAGARWFHVSNNGSHGRHRNPDVQGVGAYAGLGWRF
jgi:hypothetical protein